MKLNKKSNKGFTIIEVMIVLAIAGLILGIALVAAPNLTRNSRNNQIRTDANNILGYYADYIQSKNGAAPATICYDSGTGNVSMLASGSCPGASSDVVGKIRSGTLWSTSTPPSPLVAQTLYVQLGKKCDGSASGRAISVTFGIEVGSGNPTSSCVEG